MKVQAVQETISEKKRMRKVTGYVTRKYGSVHAFKLLKYFLEHKLARESKGFAIYEITFNIAPSQVLTLYALTKIECIADGAEEKDAEEGLNLLIKKGILRTDLETNILELNASLDSIANVYLKEIETRMKVVKDRSLADIILLPTTTKRITRGKKDHGTQPNVSGVPDLLEKDESGRYTIVEIKFGDASKYRKG